MKKRLKNLFAGTILTITLIGSSLTVLAYDCLENGHSFTTTTRVFSHRELQYSHIHENESTGELYSCGVYLYYFTVTQKCGKCNGVITIPGYDTSTLHIPH